MKAFARRFLNLLRRFGRAPDVNITINNHLGHPVDIKDLGSGSVVVTIGEPLAGAACRRGNPARRLLHPERVKR